AGDGDYGDEARRGAPEDLPVFSSIKGLTQLTDALPVGNLTRGAQTESASGFQTGDNDGVATGNQVFLDLDAPITITDNVVNVL
ncbi:MAG TPA: hypothetical protein VFT95_00895, partial [Micromonosporaceae bacterium]|nr:hypothetical protein [Micromonosporaceae bacterium]